MNEPSSHDDSIRPPHRGVVERAGTALLWYGLPVVAMLAVAAYIAGAVLWHANPPIVPVAGISMKPTLQPGDLVLVKGVETAELRKGDVIALRVPKSQQTRYGAPPAIVHRIVEIKKEGGERLFTTRGDNNSAADAFDVRPNDVIGRMVARGPGLGYPFLFFRSRQGKIFLLSVLAVAVLYFLLAFFDKRRELAEINTHTLARIIDETRALKESMQQTATGARAPPPDAVVHPVVEQADAEPAEPDLSSLPAATRALHLAEFQLAPVYREESEPERTFTTALVPYIPPRQLPAIDFDKLEEEIHRAVRSSAEVQGTMRELVGAIGEYGEHLRSHTDVMKNLAISTGELHTAASEMRQVLAALTQVVAALAERDPPAGA